jgi:hypothetical protein
MLLRGPALARLANNGEASALSASKSLQSGTGE